MVALAAGIPGGSFNDAFARTTCWKTSFAEVPYKGANELVFVGFNVVRYGRGAH